ncbi:MAG TPA: 16S rRNA (cytosine(967)-C(5))-methyltransferase RsmB [Candidatus Cloacimonadota bacterium]|nr:16S rRNA (cytosine(967)-C(5))-methyltransferase RsmB [Candidatus Cloacimonadota bacterium]HQL14214.1 16S rRNA (cytosine(967)-C(5))-methyltransferase RsmB [Candidatus Cloacimonadota bacterium]
MNIRLEAYDIIVRVLKHKDYSDNLLHQKARKFAQESQESMALLYQLVKGTIKYQANLDYICRQFTEPEKFNKTEINIKALLYLGLFQLKFIKSIPDYAAVNETVELAKQLYNESIGDFVNSILRSYLRNPEIKYPENSAERIAIEHSYPLDLIRQWIKQWGEEEAELLAMYFNEPTKLHIRVNTMATNTDKLLKYFSKRNIICHPSPASSNILICDNPAAALQDVAFNEGYFSVQDTSAALIVELLAPKPEETILDLFAAPGGKCTYIAEKMQGKGELIAVDKSPGKMKLLKQAMERLQLENINLVVKDAFQYGPVAPAFDRVLVDAPCSGWGVLGRKADLRWQQHQNIEELCNLQQKALNYAANFVKKGGYLVYSTCTLNPEENELAVEQFLKKHEQFKSVPAEKYIPVQYTADGYLKTIPHQHYMDGAFAAKFFRAE